MCNDLYAILQHIQCVYRYYKYHDHKYSNFIYFTKAACN